MNGYVDKLFILEGILLAIAGVFFFFNPAGSLLSFTLVVGVLMIVAAISKMIRGWHTDFRLYAILSGIIDILFGGILIFSPIATIEAMLMFYGAWSLVRGVFEIIMAFKDKEFGFNMKTLQGVVGIIVGLIIVLAPVVIVFILPFIPYLIGAYFIFLAVKEIYIGFHMK